jgi:hypothetical protein
MLRILVRVMKRSFYKRVGKVCALVVATSLLPLLAFADKDKDKGKEDKDRDDRQHQKHPVVPEVNAAWVLVPFVGAVLILSFRRFSRAK